LQGQPLPQIGGKGLFTLEIERALLDGDADFAVHSLKDLPPLMPLGLALAAVPPRASPLDCCVLAARLGLHPSADLTILPPDARVGTSSLRRAAQLLAIRPDLRIDSVRGNIDTRLRKLDEGFDTIILARAGLNRLGVDLSSRTHFDLPASTCLPAPGQGALALQGRDGDTRTQQVLALLDDAATRRCIEAERACMEALGAGCTTPLGALAINEGGEILLRAAIFSPDGARRVEVLGRGHVPVEVGQSVAAQLIERGALDLVALRASTSL
jgi:hydroxymethylbilane synthase